MPNIVRHPERQDVYSRVTDRIIADLERGVRPLDEAVERRACRRPQYVGMTERDFKTEVFNDRNTVMIFKHFLEERGVLSLHLLAKPKPTQRGFSTNISDKELYWLEDYIQQTCCIKNPYLLNIGKSKFLLKTAIEGITDGASSRGRHVRTFRNALGYR